MRFLFVMDPIDTVIVDEDTSFALMLEAQRCGHRVDHALIQDVGLKNGLALGTTRFATMERNPSQPIVLGDPESTPLADYDVIFVRKDPPFDDSYLWLTLVLEHVRDSTLVINDPQGLRNANEKLYACHFPDVMPQTLVDSSRDRIKAFVREVGGRAIIKPVDGHGGHGIFAINSDDKNANAIIETVTENSSKLAMVQEFVPEVVKGDKRILLIGDEIVGAILRVPRSDDVRSNIHVGGSVVHAEIDEDDRRIIEAVSPKLAEDGLYFVGLDVIGGKLTEVNVTSPTGIQQMSRLTNTSCESTVIEWIHRKVSR